MDTILTEKVRNMLVIAESYKEAAMTIPIFNNLIKQAAKKQNVTINGKPIQFDSTILSCILLYGISIEIFLKAFNEIDNGGFGRKHLLDELFNALPEPRRNSIIGKMEDVYKADFYTLLQHNKNIFVDWRYCYEKDILKCDISFLKNLSVVCSCELLQEVNGSGGIPVHP